MERGVSSIADGLGGQVAESDAGVTRSMVGGLGFRLSTPAPRLFLRYL